ncbi:hypothetical protein COCNU_10G005160 [Cocos nucifera]|uniref:Uncharacterized protein n=1 Tax=Cocos nucifera TaxID=13894 RepID=A0A8K0IMA3_COCNU|nr:hypothetical protein COCNU_10G005160 [Cocos nucifera]
MACARRSLTSNSTTHLSRRFHLSFAHILRDDRDRGAAKPPHRLPLPSSSPTPASSSRSIPGFGFSTLWDPRTLAFALPLGLRGYSSLAPRDPMRLWIQNLCRRVRKHEGIISKISNMVEKVPSFKGGGAFWSSDLTTPDPLYMLPVLTALTFLAAVESELDLKVPYGRVQS